MARLLRAGFVLLLSKGYSFFSAPSIQSTTFEYISQTTWDGVLEYRWDFNADGTWDAKFGEAKNNITIPFELLGNTVTCQVRDRFGATDTRTISFPDLKVAQFYIDAPAVGSAEGDQFNASVGDRLNLKAVIKNEGDADAVSHTLSFYVDGTQLSSHTVASLVRGESQTFISNTWVATLGTHEIKIVTDEGNLLIEPNENNNQSVKTLVAVRVSDLVTLSLDKNGSGRNTIIISSVPDGNPSFGPGNQSSAMFERGTEVELRATSSDPNVISTLWSPCGAVEVCRVRLIEDSTVVENNSEDFSKSNLQIQTASLDPSEGIAGQSVQVRFLIKNWGEGPVVNGRLNVDMSTTGWTHSDVLTISNLAAGAEETVSASVVLPQLGTYSVHGVVNSDNDSNPNNNRREYTFNFSAPQAMLNGVVMAAAANNQAASPIAGVGVAVVQNGQVIDNAKTDGQGKFVTTKSLSAGTYTLTPTSSNYSFTPSSLIYELKEGKALSALNFQGRDITPPVVQISQPSNKAVMNVGINVIIAASASDSNGIQKVDFYRDGTVLLGTATISPYQINWNISGAALGNHTLLAKAVDKAGNTGTSAVINITLTDTTAPTAKITSPLNNSMVPKKTTVVINTTATDNVGVSKVEFYVNGVLEYIDTTAPYSYAWPVPKQGNVRYNLQAKGYDAKGNVGLSAIVNVTSK